MAEFNQDQTRFIRFKSFIIVVSTVSSIIRTIENTVLNTTVEEVVRKWSYSARKMITDGYREVDYSLHDKYSQLNISEFFALSDIADNSDFIYIDNLPEESINEFNEYYKSIISQFTNKIYTAVIPSGLISMCYKIAYDYYNSHSKYADDIKQNIIVDYVKYTDNPKVKAMYELNDKLKVDIANQIDRIENQSGSFKFRDHQKKALEAVTLTRELIIKAPTGTGKTFSAYTIARLYERPTMMITNTKSLAMQNLSDFKEYGYPEDRLFIYSSEKKLLPPAHWVAEHQPYVLFIVDKSIKKITFLDDIDVLIVDETHKAKADTYIRELPKIGASIRVGLSATPLSFKSKADKLNVMSFLGPIKFNYNLKQAFNDGHLADIVYHMHTIDKITDDKGKELVINSNKDVDFHDVRRMCTIENKYFNEYIVNLTNKYKGSKILIIVDLVEHGEALCKLIPGSIFISGKNSGVQREQAREDMHNNKLDVIIATKVLTEGVNIRNIEHLIIAAPKKSVIPIIQTVGRALRKTESKQQAHIHDFYHVTHPMLKSQSDARIRLFDKGLYGKFVWHK